MKTNTMHKRTTVMSAANQLMLDGRAYYRGYAMDKAWAYVCPKVQLMGGGYSQSTRINHLNNDKLKSWVVENVPGAKRLACVKKWGNINTYHYHVLGVDGDTICDLWVN